MKNTIPMTALRALESVVRHGSITAAAAELSVTHSAISHQVRKLEKDLGVSLLSRQGRGVVATAVGVRLAEGLAVGFDAIATAIRSVKPERETEEITVSCTGTFLLRWLIPRLYRFKAAEPGVQLKLVEDFAPLNFDAGTYDLAIRVGPPPWPAGVSVTTLVPEVFGPVMSRELIDQFPETKDGDFSKVSLVQTRTRPTAWTDWAIVAGVSPPQTDAVTWFDHFYFLLEGLRAGLGAGVVPEVLAREDLARGHLIASVGFIESGNNYVVAVKEGNSLAAVSAFHDWLVMEFRETNQFKSQ